MDQDDAGRIHDELPSWRSLVERSEGATVGHQVALQLLDYIDYLEEEYEDTLRTIMEEKNASSSHA